MDSPFSFVLSGFFILDIFSLSIQKRLQIVKILHLEIVAYSRVTREEQRRKFYPFVPPSPGKKSSFPRLPLFPFCSIFFRWLEKEEEGEG